MGGIGQFERAWISLMLWVLVLAEGALLFQEPLHASSNDTGRDPAMKPACLQPASPMGRAAGRKAPSQTPPGWRSSGKTRFPYEQENKKTAEEVKHISGVEGAGIKSQVNKHTGSSGRCALPHPSLHLGSIAELHPILGYIMDWGCIRPLMCHDTPTSQISSPSAP